MDSHTTITIGDQTFTVDADDLVAQCVLGQGAYGVVEKMCHTKTNTVMAVKVSMGGGGGCHTKTNTVMAVKVSMGGRGGGWCHTKTNTVMAVKLSRVHEGVDDMGWASLISDN